MGKKMKIKVGIIKEALRKTLAGEQKSNITRNNDNALNTILRSLLGNNDEANFDFKSVKDLEQRFRKKSEKKIPADTVEKLIKTLYSFTLAQSTKDKVAELPITGS
jgi:hypothetical protein